MAQKIIDGHMHIPQWICRDGALAFDVIDAYCETAGIAYVDNMCCSNNRNLWDGYEMDQSILGAIAKLENSRVFTHGCLYIPQDVSLTGQYRFTDQLEELMELGLDGIKICDFKPDAYKILSVEARLDEYEAFLDACEKYGVHMCWHIADPEYFWDESQVSESIKKLGWFYGDGSYPSYEKLISWAIGAIERHPKLHVQLAHAFFKSFAPDEMEALLASHPHVTIDLAPGGEMFEGYRANYDAWYRIFRVYSDRFLFATDTSPAYLDGGMRDLARKVRRFLETDDVYAYSDKITAHGIKLEQAHLDNILYKNHDREVGLAPKPVSRAALKRYIERYLPLMPDSRNRQMTEEYYRKHLL